MCRSSQTKNLDFEGLWISPDKQEKLCPHANCYQHCLQEHKKTYCHWGKTNIPTCTMVWVNNNLCQRNITTVIFHRFLLEGKMNPHASANGIFQLLRMALCAYFAGEWSLGESSLGRYQDKLKQNLKEHIIELCYMIECLQYILTITIFTIISEILIKFYSPKCNFPFSLHHLSNAI